MKAKSFNITVQGASHIDKDKECQDYSVHFDGDNYTFICVCDGHGGNDYVRSSLGSKFGCEAAQEIINEYLVYVDKDMFFSDPDGSIRTLEISILEAWKKKVTSHYKANPFTEKELRQVSEKARKKYSEGNIFSAYGTTLIAAAVTEEFWFGIHIGDGKLIAVNPEGNFKQPVKEDPNCFLNMTTSLCDEDAIESFRHFYSQKLPAAIFLGTDGVDDSFQNTEQMYNLYKPILFSFGTGNFEEAEAELRDYLPRLSRNGSGDDISIAAMFDIELLPELSIVKEYNVQQEAAKVSENARLEKERAEEARRIREEEIKKAEEEKRQREERIRIAEENKRKRLEEERRQREEREKFNEANRRHIENAKQREEYERKLLEAKKQSDENERRRIEAEKKSDENERRRIEAERQLKEMKLKCGESESASLPPASETNLSAEKLMEDEKRRSAEANRRREEMFNRSIEIEEEQARKNINIDIILPESEKKVSDEVTEIRPEDCEAEKVSDTSAADDDNNSLTDNTAASEEQEQNDLADSSSDDFDGDDEIYY